MTQDIINIKRSVTLLPTDLGHYHQKSGKADHSRAVDTTADKFLPNKAMQSWPEKPSQSFPGWTHQC